MNEGIKHDQGKRMWRLLPWDALDQIVAVMEHGRAKYGERNWEKGMSFSRLFDANKRHMIAWYQGEEMDSETHISHLAHAACNSLYLLTYALRRIGLDDRPSKETNDSIKVQSSSNSSGKGG